MIIKQFIFNPFQENTYLIFDETNEAVVIDAGCSDSQEFAAINNVISKNGLTLKYLVNTHCHIDHVLGVSELLQKYNVDFLAHKEEETSLKTLVQYAVMFGVEMTEAPAISRYLSEADTLTFGKTTLQVVHTPGHTPGGICLYAHEQGVIFTGDTLFQGSIGRTDLPGGSYNAIIHSISTKLFTLPSSVVAYPGHGSSTNIAFEKQNNPFFC